MNGYAGSAVPPGGMYVRALYDYDADDRTSLSFQQGDIIQVITQLESGWWDGVIDGVRGWFPSNYCQLVTGPIEEGDDNGHESDSTGGQGEEIQDEFGDGYESSAASEGTRSDISRRYTGRSEEREQEEAAFWIPQATPDGRLYYFNTLTGVSTMELPLETPTSMTESGPRDRTNVFIPESTRPPPELMAGGKWEREDDTDYSSASDAEGGRSALEESTGSLVSNLQSCCFKDWG